MTIPKRLDMTDQYFLWEFPSPKPYKRKASAPPGNFDLDQVDWTNPSEFANLALQAKGPEVPAQSTLPDLENVNWDSPGEVGNLMFRLRAEENGMDPAEVDAILKDDEGK
jgi:hypothetical protein